MSDPFSKPFTAELKSVHSQPAKFSRGQAIWMRAHVRGALRRASFGRPRTHLQSEHADARSATRTFTHTRARTQRTHARIARKNALRTLEKRLVLEN
eukprot:4378924-Pleurochrysis_carterae.AAC.7